LLQDKEATSLAKNIAQLWIKRRERIRSLMLVSNIVKIISRKEVDKGKGLTHKAQEPQMRVLYAPEQYRPHAAFFASDRESQRPLPCSHISGVWLVNFLGP